MHEHNMQALVSLQRVRDGLPPPRSLFVVLPSGRRKLSNFHSLAMECSGKRKLLIVHDEMQALVSSLISECSSSGVG